MEGRIIYENTRCPICGQGMTESINCQRWGANICPKHCEKCRYYVKLFGNCMYLRQKKTPES